MASASAHRVRIRCEPSRAGGHDPSAGAQLPWRTVDRATVLHPTGHQLPGDGLLHGFGEARSWMVMDLRTFMCWRFVLSSYGRVCFPKDVRDMWYCLHCCHTKSVPTFYAATLLPRFHISFATLPCVIYHTTCHVGLCHLPLICHTALCHLPRWPVSFTTHLPHCHVSFATLPCVICHSDLHHLPRCSVSFALGGWQFWNALTC